jgi:hypothetical protein
MEAVALGRAGLFECLLCWAAVLGWWLVSIRLGTLVCLCLGGMGSQTRGTYRRTKPTPMCVTAWIRVTANSAQLPRFQSCPFVLGPGQTPPSSTNMYWQCHLFMLIQQLLSLLAGLAGAWIGLTVQHCGEYPSRCLSRQWHCTVLAATPKLGLGLMLQLPPAVRHSPMAVLAHLHLDIHTACPLGVDLLHSSSSAREVLPVLTCLTASRVDVLQETMVPCQPTPW